MKNKMTHLETVVLEPKHCSPKYTLVWSNGVCTTYKDYMRLLEPLADSARIVAYNYRSHGGSKKRFSPSRAVEDLEDIVQAQDNPIFLAGHCTGAAVSSTVKEKVQGRILLCPYLGADYLAAVPRIVMKLGRYLPVCLMDKAITYFGLANYIGVKNTRPLQDILALGRFRPSANGSSAMWMVASHDEVLGTVYSRQYQERMCAYLKGSYPEGIDRSRLVKGLNHSLNTIPGQLLPFLSSCPHKRQQRIVDSILDYCESNL